MNVFYCYAHEDEHLRDRLASHLSGLRRHGLIAEWHDRAIVPGSEWKASIDKSLETADVVLLLISADFLASEFCYDVEMQRALQRHRAGESVVVPVILRPVDWDDAPFRDLQAVPTDGVPVTRWDDMDEALMDVAKKLRTLIAELAQHRCALSQHGDASAEEAPDEEAGLFELSELSDQEFEVLTKVVSRMGELIAELGEQANRSNAAATEVNTDGTFDRKRAKPIIDDMARNLSEFAGDMTGLIEEYAQARERGFGAILRACELGADFGIEGIEALNNNRRQLTT